MTIITFAVPELLDLIWRKIGFFTLCSMITWVMFLRMFWNFISSLPVKKGGSLSFLVRTISNVLVMEIGWTDVGSGRYILVSTVILVLICHSPMTFCTLCFHVIVICIYSTQDMTEQTWVNYLPLTNNKSNINIPYTS